MRALLGALCALALLPLGLAAATPQDVLTDWAADGKVDGQTNPDPQLEFVHTAGDLQNAKGLIQAQDPTNAGVVIAAIQEAIDRDVIGIQPPSADPAAPSAPEVALPAWVVAAAVGAGILVLAGIASAVFRRTRHRPA
jgi:hypothetical protein